MMNPAEIEPLEKQLEARIADGLRYDMKAVLVPLVGGGYNIVLHNRRSRSEVRGLCDPSFVAFNVASYTSATNWKSENLQIWLSPFEEGWSVPTRGSRAAVEYGQAHSPLGMYGVVEVRAFRTWLEKSFHPIQSTPATLSGGEIEHDFALEPLPPRVDAGIDTLVGHSPASLADAGRAEGTGTSRRQKVLTGETDIEAAWRLYGEGNQTQARAALRRAQRTGVDSPELGVLLQDSQ